MNEVLQYCWGAVLDLCTPAGILFLFGGSLIGLVLGSLPGLSGGTLTVLLLPIMYKIEPVMAMALLISIYTSSTSGGCIGSILLGIPGTNSSIATVWDGYEFTKQGDPVRPLSVAVICNFIGTLPSMLIAMICCKALAEIAVKMGPWEYAGMCFCAVALVVGLTKGNMAKGLIGVGLAIVLSSMGPDPLTGMRRLTFDVKSLYGGINVIQLMLGMFAAKVIMLEYSRRDKVDAAKRIKVDRFRWPGKDLKSNLGNMFRSFFTGAFIGFLPGLGGPTSTVVAYSTERSLSKEKEKWGKGHIGGVIAPEIANNAGIGGALIPMIALGVPGDAAMVHFMAALQSQGINPGPLLMSSHPDIAYMLFVGGIICGVFVLICEIVGMPLFPKLLKIPYHYLYPAIIVVSFIGAYMVKGNMFGMIVCLGACVLGIFMEYFEIPEMPFIMTVILSSLLEKNIRQGMNFSFVGFAEFFTRPVSCIFIVVGLAMLLWHAFGGLVIKALRKKSK
ncbi:MAG: Tat pathway signal protein [Ruminococcaceae bacterium]|nr:Tat pathway signal protein [Oscillospiraceae bacterium]